MTTGSIWDYNTTPGSNSAIAGTNISPGCPASGVGPFMRQIMADVKGSLIALTAGGTADAITASLTPAPTALTDGMRVWVRAAGANTLTNPTFQLNALGTTGTIKKLGGTALVAGDISGAGHAIELEYVSSDNHWELLNPRNVAGPSSSTTGNVAIFADASGSVLQDSGTTPAIWTTGDVKITLKTAADSGWVMMNDGTIGDATSGGTTRANADTSALFTLLWNNTTNANCPVSSGRGASAAADFAAHKTITLPLVLGRALAASGAGSGLTSRSLALATGAEAQTISANNLPTHTHPAGSLSFSGSVASDPNWVTGTGINGVHGGADQITPPGSTPVSGTISGSTGNNTTTATALSIMQPASFLNVMIKL